MKVLRYVLGSFLLFSFYLIKPDVIGSDTAVSALPNYVFPPVPGNRIAYFGWVQNGFSLQNQFTSVLFDSVFPVSGPIQLNGGTLTLNRDFIFNNQATFNSLGTIIGGNHVFSISPSITALPLQSGTFQDIQIILNGDLTINSPITLSGICLNCLVQGNGYRIILGPSGSLTIDGSVTLHDLILEGVQGTNVQCANDAASLHLDGMTLILSDNFSFAAGSLLWSDSVTFKGTYTFAYESTQTSTIDANGTLLFDTGFTFDYAPSNSSQTRLNFVDATSLLILNSATLRVAGPGLRLLKGSLLVASDSIISADTQITFGDDSAADDFAVTLAAGARLTCSQGTLNYHNALLTSWTMNDNVSNLFMSINTTLALYQTLNIGSGLAIFDNNTTLARVPAATLQGSIISLGTLNFVII